MKNIAFILYYSDSWMGGTNYTKNVLYALSTQKNKNIKIILFAGKKNRKEIESIFRKYSKNSRIIYSYQFDNKKILSKFILYLFLFYKLILLIFKINYFDYLMKKNNINLVINSAPAGPAYHGYKTINWIADFQHLYLKEMFSEEEIYSRDRNYLETIIASNRIILNSKSAYSDYKEFAPDFINKAKVIPFVTHIEKEVLNNKYDLLYKKKYKITNKYFYMPNQFWQHKNHELILKSLYIAVKKEKNILIVFSGHMQDYRNKNHITKIMKMIKSYNLSNNIKLLGLIDYYEVISLIRNSIAIINPSLFEGRSTTVEEAKSLGKLILLSDIPIHREQHPPGGIYFNSSDPDKLAKILIKVWRKEEGGINIQKEKKALNQSESLLKNYSKNYYKVIHETLQEK